MGPRRVHGTGVRHRRLVLDAPGPPPGVASSTVSASPAGYLLVVRKGVTHLVREGSAPPFVTVCGFNTPIRAPILDPDGPVTAPCPRCARLASWE